MQFRNRHGEVGEIHPTDDELIEIATNCIEALRQRSSIIECVDCGERVLVNNQDFHVVTRCAVHRIP